VVRTNWQAVRDVPLRVNGALIGWSEFEVVGNRLAVRVTELA
jgi:flagellar motor switch/type III secretory pathway protein FliN